MSVSCNCDVWAPDEVEWWYELPKDFAPLTTKRRQRCYACRVLIELGADCGHLPRWRCPQSDIEERIHGDEVPLAPAYLCEECFGLLLSVYELGGCVTLEKGEALKDAVAEWRAQFPNGCNEERQPE